MTNLLHQVRHRLAPEHKRTIAKMLQRMLTVVPHHHNLSILAMKHGTTKWGNGYMEAYETHFKPLRHKALNILEIGVGGYQDPQSGGESLGMWQEYFPRSRIFSIDVVDKSVHDSKRIKTFVGSQNDPDFLKQIASSIGRIDIVIDDGSHCSEHIITSFQTLFPLLADRGIYVIEDLAWSYWPQNGGNWRDLGTNNTSMGMLKQLTDGLNHQFIPNRKPGYFDQHIAAIHFYPQLAFIIKGQNTKDLPRYILDEIDRAGRVS